MTAVEELSAQCGIVDSFVDARGRTRATSESTRRALLTAMGFHVGDEGAARAALKDLRRQTAERSLPAVHVHDRSLGPLEFMVNGPPTSTQEWRLELEDGTVKRGRLQDRSDLPYGRRGSASSYLRIEEELPLGYHTLRLEPDASHCSLIVSPGECWLPPGVMEGRRLWGVAAQLYLLRSKSNWGIGDYGDLENLVQALAARGADVVGLNPLHAMFPDDPEQASPYSPASRLLLNILNIDVARVAESLDCEAARSRMSSAPFQDSLLRARSSPLLDYSAVTALKQPLLEQLFQCCDRSSADWQSFVNFRAGAGGPFERSCLFLALRHRFAQRSSETADWQAWPEEYRRPDSPETQSFARDQPEAVTFQAWMQFIADQQLAECAAAARGMAIGLYRDLAVGAARGGAETWSNPRSVIGTINVGAPPDIYNPQGQDWGLPPFDPRALREEGYRSFIELLRANMRHAGGLRIDHVMALQQLYWIPDGASPAEGAYVRYPMDDLVAILALESHRHRCLVVGEDLGTVPEGFRERMARARILSYRVLFFEKNEGEFTAPEKYPPLAVAVAGSHDLPTLRAWWQGSDLALKKKLDLYPLPEHEKLALEERKADRQALGNALRRRNLANTGALKVDEFIEAAHTYLASTRSAVAILQIDDLTGEVNPVNVPTTAQEHPNWRRRSSVNVEQLATDARFISATATLSANRPASPA